MFGFDKVSGMSLEGLWFRVALKTKTQAVLGNSRVHFAKGPPSHPLSVLDPNPIPNSFFLPFKRADLHEATPPVQE